MGVDEEFSAFVARAWPALVRSAVLLTGDQAAAEDLVQTALIRTHRRWRSIVARDRPDAYVRQVVLNEYRSWWRRHGGRERLVERIPDRSDRGGGPNPPSERQVALHQALAQLPARMRATLVLRFYD